MEFRKNAPAKQHSPRANPRIDIPLEETSRQRPEIKVIDRMLENMVNRHHEKVKTAHRRARQGGQ